MSDLRDLRKKVESYYLSFQHPGAYEIPSRQVRKMLEEILDSIPKEPFAVIEAKDVKDLHEVPYQIGCYVLAQLEAQKPKRKRYTYEEIGAPTSSRKKGCWYRNAPPNPGCVPWQHHGPDTGIGQDFMAIPLSYKEEEIDE